MTEQTAKRPHFNIGRRTATERAYGRLLRDPEEHPPAPPAAVDPAPEPVDASLIAAPEGAASVRPEGLPDEFWDADANAIKPEAYARLAELHAAAQSAREGVPENADGYELTLAEPINGPDGKPVTFDANDPLAKAVLPVLHEGEVPQPIVSKLLAAFAKVEVEAVAAENAAATERRNAEIAKLGATPEAVTARTSAAHGQITAAIGAEHAEALRQVMSNADAFIALETLVSKLQGPAFSAAPLKTPAMPDIATRLYG